MSTQNRPTKRLKTIYSFFKKDGAGVNVSTSDQQPLDTSQVVEPTEFHAIASASIDDIPITDQQHHGTSETEIPETTELPNHPSETEIPETTELPNQQPHITSETVELRAFDASSLERDPGKRIQIYECPINQRDEIRRAYIKLGPYQPKLLQYPKIRSGSQNRRFTYSWFTKFSWLEYSPSKNKAFCFPCFLFAKGPTSNPALTSLGFNDWKRVNDGKKCVFLHHVGGPSSLHNKCVSCVEDFMNSAQHVDIIMNRQNQDQILKNRLRLKTTIECVRWLTYQGCAFRGHDESVESTNRGNCIELIKHTAKFSDEVAAVVLENAPRNAIYTSPLIQKQILNILADKVRRKIREDIGNAVFCILVDEAQDISYREQMAIVIRFVDRVGFVRERFFQIVMVEDTAAATLKEEITKVLLHYDLPIEKMRGQGYDGASNMRGEWNGLQALFLRDCPYAYYVHCFAHQLQLALVASAKSVVPIWLFFSSLNMIINVICASPKRHTEFQIAQVLNIADLVATGERETGRGANQLGTLHRPGATRWGSHFDSVCDVIDRYAATCMVLEDIVDNGNSMSIRAEATGANSAIRSFEFIFILHLLKETMGLTDILCRALQQKSQDILNAIHLVETTRVVLGKLREDGWDGFFEKVESFCKLHDIDIPDMNARYIKGRGRSCQQTDHITVKHHYRFDIFNAAIDFQLTELNSRFSERTGELLILSSALNPRDGFKYFQIEDICSLAEKFYPQDFTRQELHVLRCELTIYQADVPHHPMLKNVSTLTELCQGLVETNRSQRYCMIDRLIRLVLTLPVSTATTERAFSAMKHIKNALRNKMENEFLADNMMVHIEKELAENFNSDSVIKDFASKDRRVQFE